VICGGVKMGKGIGVEYLNKIYDKEGDVADDSFFLFLTNGQVIRFDNYQQFKYFVQEVKEIEYRIDEGFEELD